MHKLIHQLQIRQSILWIQHHRRLQLQHQLRRQLQHHLRRRVLLQQVSGSGSSSDEAMSLASIQSFNMRVNADYDEIMTAYPDMEGWAARVVQTVYAMENGNGIQINDLMRGSVIIDYALQTDTKQAMEALIARMNDTTSIQLDGRTFIVLSNRLVDIENDDELEDADLGKMNGNFDLFIRLTCALVLIGGVMTFLCCYSLKKRVDEKNELSLQPMVEFVSPMSTQSVVLPQQDTINIVYGSDGQQDEEMEGGEGNETYIE